MALAFCVGQKMFFIGGKFYTTVSDKHEVEYIMNYNVGQQIMVEVNYQLNPSVIRVLQVYKFYKSLYVVKTENIKI